MIDDIDFELCIGVEKHAAISHHEKMSASSARVDDDHGAVNMDVNGEFTSTSKERPLHEQESDSESTQEPRRSNKRTRISASGSWREGDARTGNGQQDAMDWKTSFCSGTMDESLSSPDHSKHRDVPPYASFLSGTNTRTKPSVSTSTSPTSKSQRKSKAKPNLDESAPSFTIYEDPEDHDLQSFTLDLGMGYGLEFGLTYRYEHDSSPGIPIPIPESWHSCPGDDKENADEGMHEHGTNVEYEADGGDHSIWNGSDDDEDASTIIVDDVRGDNERPRHGLAHGHSHDYNHREIGGLRRYYQHRTENGAVVLPPRERSQGHEGQISPTLLGAPPRRFQGRGSRQAQRIVIW